MKKTTYLVIISIITIICVIAGSIIHFGEMSLGWGFPWGFPWGASGDDKTLEKTVTLDEFSDMEIDLRAMDLTIERGDSYELSYQCNKEIYVPTSGIVDRVLVVKQRHDRIGFNIGKAKCKMVLTVPEQAVINNIQISNDTGDVKLNNIEGDMLTLDIDTGDLKIEGSTFNKTDIDNDVGDIKLTACSLGDCNIENNTGDIKLSDCSFGRPDGDVHIKNDTGDVVVEGCEDLYLYETDFSTDIGGITVNGNNIKGKHYSEKAMLESNLDNISRFTISTDIGEIVVSQRQN